MKVVLDLKINQPLKQNDIIVFNNGIWQTIDKTLFLSDFKKEIENLKDMISLRDTALIEYKQKVNEELQKLHNVLNILTKEND